MPLGVKQKPVCRLWGGQHAGRLTSGLGGPLRRRPPVEEPEAPRGPRRDYRDTCASAWCCGVSPPSPQREGVALAQEVMGEVEWVIPSTAETPPVVRPVLGWPP